MPHPKSAAFVFYTSLGCKSMKPTIQGDVGAENLPP